MKPHGFKLPKIDEFYKHLFMWRSLWLAVISFLNFLFLYKTGGAVRDVFVDIFYANITLSILGKVQFSNLLITTNA